MALLGFFGVLIPHQVSIATLFGGFFLNRAFVEFSRNPVEGFRILPAVYLSVKMSQLKIPFELNVHYPGDIERQLPDVRAVKSLR